MSYSGVGAWAAFTVSQWQELEHQAFIFKYLKAGLSVPPDLLTPIRMSLDSTLFNHPALGYSAPYGKKYDPEPGRCRRTDGKKWRCAKDAYPDSKYCERHMNRTRNRSRKLVESKTTSQSISTVASGLATASSSGSGNLQNPPLQSYGNQDELYNRSNVSQLQLESTPYGLCTKDYRGHHGQKPEAEKLNFTPESSHSVNAIGMNSNISSEWCFPKAEIASYPVSEPRNGTLLQFNNPQGQNFEPAVSVDGAMAKQQQEHYFFGMELNPALPVKQDHHSLFDSWPKSRHFGSYMGDQKSDTKTTQLSMSIPIAPSDFRGQSPKW